MCIHNCSNWVAFVGEVNSRKVYSGSCTMEAPLKERGMVESASENSENEMEGEEEKYLAEQHDERRSLPTLVSKESDSGSDDLGTEEKILSNKGYSATVSSDHDRKRALNDIERITDTDKSTMSNAEIDDDQTGDDEDSSEVSSTDNVYQGRLGKERECEEFGKANPPMHGSASESFELEGQLSGYNVMSLSQEKCQSNENFSVESLTPVPKVNKSLSSQVKGGRDIGSDSLEDDGHGTEELPKSEEEYVKKGFSCRGGADEADEELREYWTRALQTSTSTGEMVEEIVKVLKHHQKTHDLLCPVCGSCVTRRVILRKRKRSSYISVDRWYRDPLDEGEVQEEGALPEGAGVEVEERDTQDIEAFGCLSCFSLFFDKGRQLLNQLQEIGPDNFNCLPFFFPPYPWGMTQMKFRSTGSHAEESSLEVVEEPPPPQEQDASSMVVGPDFSCGISSTLLPDYPWGTTHFLSKGKLSGQTDVAIEAGSSMQVVEQEREDIDGSLCDENICSCGLASAITPAYPWGVCRKHSRELENAGAFSQSVEPPPINESTCTCGIAQALFPEYQWGYLRKPEDADSGPKDASPIVPEDANLQNVSQPEITETVPHLEKEERTCTCGLIPALIPNYSWVLTGKYRDTAENKIHTQAKPVQEMEGKEAEDKASNCDLGSALLPGYPWGITSASQEQYGRLQPDHDQDAVDRDRTCGLGFTMLPEFPWGQSLSTAKSKPQTSSQEVKSYVEQETKIEARITSKTDVFTVTTTKMTYPGEKPPQSITTMIPQETSQTVQHVKLDQMVTVIDASVQIDQAGGTKRPPLASLPSTGFALLDLEEGDLGGKERIETQPSTGYARLDKLIDEQELPTSEIEEDPASLKYTYSETKLDNNWQSSLQGSYDKQEKIRPQTPPSGTQFPSFEWSVGKLDAGHLTTPLLKASIEPETETFVSVLKPAPVGLDQPKSENWLSVFKVSKPADDGGLTAPLLSPASAYTEEIEEVKRPVSRPQIQVAAEAVIDVPPSDSGRPSVGAIPATVPGLATTKKETDEWDILKSIVYGGLDISIASIGVTSSAAGGNAITRTVVYMGLATLLSGLIGFYHNVLNLYHHHRDHYINVVGVTLMLHGTVALISFVLFGLLSPLVYLFSYRETDDRDDKFITCCVVTIVAVTALALGKAKVSNKRYLKTLFAYLGGGVLAAIIGYLAGEHVAELLEEWGF